MIPIFTKRRNQSLKRQRSKLKPKQDTTLFIRGIKVFVNLTVIGVMFLFSVGYKQNLTDEIQALETRIDKFDLANQAKEIETQLKASKKNLEDVTKLANTSLEQKVCSRINRYNTKAHESYNLFVSTYQEMCDKLKEYNSDVKEAKKLVNEINELKEKLNDSEKEVVKEKDEIAKSFNEINNLKKDAEELLNESQENADTRFNHDYPLMLNLTASEAGAEYCSDEMQFYTMAVPENRQLSKNFPNTLDEVIFQEGQYACTWNGMWGNTQADERTAENVRKYLRGEIELQISEKVVYQSGFPQGKTIKVFSTNDGNEFYGEEE